MEINNITTYTDFKNYDEVINILSGVIYKEKDGPLSKQLKHVICYLGEKRNKFLLPIEIYYNNQSSTVKINWDNGGYKKLTLTILNSSTDSPCYITTTIVSQPLSFLRDTANIETYLNKVILKEDQNSSKEKTTNFSNKDFENEVINLLEEILNKYNKGELFKKGDTLNGFN